MEVTVGTKVKVTVKVKFKVKVKVRGAPFVALKMSSNGSSEKRTSTPHSFVGG